MMRKMIRDALFFTFSLQPCCKYKLYPVQTVTKMGLCFLLENADLASIGLFMAKEKPLMSLLKSPRSLRWLTGGAAIGVTYFAGVAIALEAFRTDNNPLKVALSFYAHGPYGFLLNSAFLVLAAGTFALAFGLRSWFHRPGRLPVGLLLLGMSGLGDTLAGLFNNDFPPPGFPPRSLSGTFHTLGSFTSLLAFDIAMFVLARQFRAHPEWRSFSRTAFYLGLLIVVMEIIWIVAQLASPYVGAVEDVLLFLILLWQILTALQLYSKTTRKESIKALVEPERAR